MLLVLLFKAPCNVHKAVPCVCYTCSNVVYHVGSCESLHTGNSESCHVCILSLISETFSFICILHDVRFMCTLGFRPKLTCWWTMLTYDLMSSFDHKVIQMKTRNKCTIFTITQVAYFRYYFLFT